MIYINDVYKRRNPTLVSGTNKNKLTLCNVEKPQLGACTRVLEKLQTAARTSESVRSDNGSRILGHTTVCSRCVERYIQEINTLLKVSSE